MNVTFVAPMYHNIWEPLGIGIISSYIKEHSNDDIDVKFFHGNFDDEEDIIAGCIKSDVVAMTATTPTFQYCVDLLDDIKTLNPNVHTVVGGWHPTAVPEEMNKYSNIIDQVIVGEGEKAFTKILNGEAYWSFDVRGDHLDFDEIPWADRELIRQADMLDLCYDMCGERIASFQSRRGCMMSCTFCGEICMSDQNVRVRDSKDVLDEIEYVNEKYKITRFKFVDPTWSFPSKAGIEFCEGKLKRGNKLPWESMVHPSYITKEMLELMKESNCAQINIGVESGNQGLLNDMKKGSTVGQIRRVFRWCKEVEIESRAFLLLGMFNENKETINDTKKFVAEIDPDHVGMTILCPYPGTEYYDPIKYKDVDWSRADEYSNDFWYTKNFTNRELKGIQKEFVTDFKDKVVWHNKVFAEGV